MGESLAKVGSEVRRLAIMTWAKISRCVFFGPSTQLSHINRADLHQLCETRNGCPFFPLRIAEMWAINSVDQPPITTFAIDE
jgi:hypothetical protein